MSLHSFTSIAARLVSEATDIRITQSSNENLIGTLLNCESYGDLLSAADVFEELEELRSDEKS